MQCKCGFENAADAKLCGNCRVALVKGPDGVMPAPATPSDASVPELSGGGHARLPPRGRTARGHSLARHRNLVVKHESEGI